MSEPRHLPGCKVEELETRYTKALHAVQAGVAAEIGLDGEAAGDRSPKQLRVGVNSALIDSSAVMLLLERKGIATREELMGVLVEMAEAEVRLYETKLTKRLGRPVTLG